MPVTQNSNRRHLQCGFTLLEALIAIVIMSVGILSLAVVYAQGIQVANKTQLDYIAEKQAEQALETVFAARDSKLLTWASIQNVSNGGVFIDGPTPLLAPGPDGLYGTADDDAANPVVVIINAGPDKILGTADDVVMPLREMTRTIAITPVAGETGLRLITITLNYRAGNLNLQYTLVSYISEFS
jgi:prepilin-type N-terminal cleavage/methylation domain-containing protein